MVLAHNINDNLRTEDVQISQDITFDTMFLSETTLKGLKDSGFLKPSPIQLHGIPLGKCGFDLLLEAKSGTGKTAVFTVIALENLELKKGLQVVVLAPTREIAAQICDVFRQIGAKYEDLQIEVVMGGLPIQDDIQKFKDSKVNVVVGSPGRLKHLIQDKYIDVSAVRLLVLDEADKLMEKSFLTDIKFIHMVLPMQKQVILSSATYPDTIKEKINQFVHDPQHLCPNSSCVLLGVAQRITTVKYNINIVRQTELRFKELLKILTMKQFKQCLVFCNYQARVGELHKLLTRKKWPAEQLYGQQDQTDRLDALKTLQEYKCRILISTDLAARGIDASNVDLVINFEPPFEWQTYLHRIGRAGRFGSYGIAITILSEGNEQKKFLSLLDSLDISYVTNLWSGNEISETVEEKSDISDSRITKKIQYNDGGWKELWNFICGEDENYIYEDKNKVESFDELLNSLRHTEVESFSNLLASFNDDKLSTVELDVHYKNVAIPKQYSKNLNVLDTLNGEASHKYVQDDNDDKVIKDESVENKQTTNEIYATCPTNESVLKDLDHKQESEGSCDLNPNLIDRYNNCCNEENTPSTVDEYEQILFSKTDASKDEFEQIPFSKTDASKDEFEQIPFAKTDASKDEFEQIPFSKTDASKDEFEQIPFSKTDASKDEFEQIPFSKTDASKDEFEQIPFSKTDASKDEFEQIPFSKTDAYKDEFEQIPFSKTDASKDEFEQIPFSKTDASKDEFEQIPFAKTDASKDEFEQIPFSKTDASKDEFEQIPFSKTDASKDESLEKLQLPTSFVSSKTRKIKKKKSNRIKPLQQEEPNEILTNVYEKPLQQEEQPNDILTNVYETRIGSKKKLPNISLKKSEPSKHNTHLNYKPRISSIHSVSELHSPPHLNLRKINSTQNLTYEQWYSQLKLRVKYVERALYIEELSKM